MGEFIRDVLTVLERLQSRPRHDSNLNKPADNSSINLLITANIQKAREVLEIHPNLKTIFESFHLHAEDSVDPTWSFTVVALKLLLSLKSLMDSNKDKKGNLLNFSQQKIIKSILQFVVGLGLIPYLEENVGIPITARASVVTVERFQAVNTSQEVEHSLRLLDVLKQLVTILDDPNLASIILNSHYNDILAGLCQISYSPHVKKLCAESAGCSSQITEDNVALCRTELRKLLENGYQPDVMRELLLLQGGPFATQSSKGSKFMPASAPVWLRRSSSRLLSYQLIRENGVKSLLIAMMPTGGDSDWRKHEAMARIIVTCPKNMNVEEYYRALAPQLKDLLHDQDALVGQNFIPVSVATVKLALELHLQLGKDIVLGEILEPLFRAIKDDVTYEANLEIIDSFILTRCVNDLHLLLTVGQMSHALLSCLRASFLHTLLCLCCHLHDSSSQLRSKCLEVLSSLMNNCDEAKVTGILEQLAFEGLLQKEAKLDEEIILALMSNKLQFKSNQDAVSLVTKDCAVNTQVEIAFDANYCQTLVGLLQRLEKKRIISQFFILLLKELTKVISSPLEASRSEGHKSSVGSQAGNQSGLLLQLELRIHRNDQRQGYNLRVLYLLAELTPILDPETLCGDPKYITSFLEATLERCILVLKTTDDTDLGEFENETITMAMGLLSTYLELQNLGLLNAANEGTDMEACFKDMQILVPRLEELQRHHPHEGIRELAANLAVSVATHGKVQSMQATGTAADEVSNDREMKNLLFEDCLNLSGVGQLRKDKTKIEVLASHDFDSETDIGKTNPKTKSNKDGETLEESVNESKQCESQVLSKEPKVGITLDSESSTVQVQEGNSEKHGKQSNVAGGNEVILGANSADQSKKMNNKSVKLDTCIKSETRPAKEAETGMKLASALAETRDLLIPTQGHGLITLRRLIEQRDEETLQSSQLLPQLQSCLRHPDSYVYLSAINALVALAELKTSEVLHVLCQEMTGVEGNVQVAMEMRLKLAEVIVKVTKGLGDLAPRYRNLLLNTMLVGAQDRETFIRASSLVNMAELCKLLGWSLGAIIHEVLDCVSSLLKTDEDVHVRRAAANFLMLLLQGQGHLATEILADVLRDLYRLLKHVIRTEKDDLVKAHIGLALQELDVIMKEYMFPKQTLTKQIRVLDP